ncbi:MOSC N-terminal beta barrel domain-containing protein [Candidimonas nitroreducens]|uniref:Molybdenum cofactor sulfurase middle domain-containing protein n=1 Tax=Candidimonas nitroreducens TaxID=683354 RepID=A0A225MB01_9BURK|nr:MOSC N-terminal beta barrel domain-containing protein [Candidimonas nitroreducens]OWT58408.1 hypothetical protein CEY11_15675 [Candidimonas nitroreducens]
MTQASGSPAAEPASTLYFPVESCAGIAGSDAAAYDRRWFVTDAEGRWLSRGRQPGLEQVEVTLRYGYLVLRAPGMLRMDIPLDVIEDDDSVRRQAYVGSQQIDAVDEGDLAAAWMSNFLGVPARLYKVHPEAPAVAWEEA